MYFQEFAEVMIIEFMSFLFRLDCNSGQITLGTHQPCITPEPKNRYYAILSLNLKWHFYKMCESESPYACKLH